MQESCVRYALASRIMVVKINAELGLLYTSSMQSWGWANVSPVAAGKFSEDTQVHQVSPQGSPVSTPAASTEVSPESSDDSALTTKDRRAALEEEVEKLREKLEQEVKLHNALDQALQRPVGVLPRIPSYLPAKIQKLLADVAVLEEEVIRLEDQAVSLKQEISDDTTAQLPTPKLSTVESSTRKVTTTEASTPKPAPINDDNLSKPSNLSKLRVTKEAVKEVPKESTNVLSTKEVPKEPANVQSSKVSTAFRKATKASNDITVQKSKDEVKEQTIPKPSKLPFPPRKDSESSKLLVSSSKEPEPSSELVSSATYTSSHKAPQECSQDSQKGLTGGKAAAAGPTPGPPTRKAPAESDVLSRFQGLQQPWKPSGGGKSGSKNLFRQFNSLGWGDSKSSTAAAKQPALVSSPRNSPRAGIAPTSKLSVNWSDKKSSAIVSSPRSSPRLGLPLSGTSSTGRLWEKENFQSAAAKLLTSKSPRSSKLGQSVDLPSSNVELMSTLGSKGSQTPPGNLSNMSIIKEAPEQASEANQLAEELVKCLICIYSKLAKLSPSTAGSKGSPLPRSKTSGSKGKPSSETLPDLYGISKNSPPRDISPYRNTQEVTVETIDSSGVGSYTVLYKKLGSLMGHLEKANLDKVTHHEKLAFWINIYNVCMMNAFLEHGIPSSPSQVVALMRKAVVNVGGYTLNSLTIEHYILRLPGRPKNVRTSSWKPFQRNGANPAMAFLKNKGMEEIVERSAYGLDWSEPLVTFALCCGSRSSPVLRVYTASAIESELETAKIEYLQAAVGVNSHQKKIYIPKLLEWYMRDFAKDMEGLLDWLCQQLSGSLRDAVQECVNHPKEGVLSHSIEVMPYDFNFRYLFLT